LLDTLDEVLKALVAIERGEIRTVRLGCTPLADRSLFHDLCATHKTILSTCPIRSSYGDTLQLADEVAVGTLDAAIVTLPLTHPDLHVEMLCKRRLVVYLRKDDKLTQKSSLQPGDLKGNLAVLYHPQRHPGAHQRLMELVSEVGIEISDYSCQSHPLEMQTLVKESNGFASIGEGMKLEEELTTHPIAGVDWTVDTAMIYRKTVHPKTIPLLVRMLRKQEANR